MGADKGLVELGGSPLASYVANILAAVADEVVISVGKGRRCEYSDALGGDFRFVEVEHEGVGPLEGLVRGMSEARGEYVLVSPCDTPFLRREVCWALSRLTKDRDGAVPKTGANHFEPLHGAYRRSALAEALEKVISGGGRAPIQAFEGLDLVFLEGNSLLELDPELVSFWNINTPEDLRKAEVQLSRFP